MPDSKEGDQVRLYGLIYLFFFFSNRNTGDYDEAIERVRPGFSYFVGEEPLIERGLRAELLSSLPQVCYCLCGEHISSEFHGLVHWCGKCQEANWIRRGQTQWLRSWLEKAKQVPLPWIELATSQALHLHKLRRDRLAEEAKLSETVESKE